MQNDIGYLRRVYMSDIKIGDKEGKLDESGLMHGSTYKGLDNAYGNGKNH